MSAWSKGLLAGAISGASGGVINVFAAIGIAPDSFNLHAAKGFKHVLILMGISAVFSGVLGLALYFKQSPLPPASGK